MRLENIRKRLGALGRRSKQVLIGSAISEFCITTLYALSSILIGTILLGFQSSYSWIEAISDNAREGEVLIAALALMGPLAYSVVADPPIRFRSFFQFVVLGYTLICIPLYVLNKGNAELNNPMVVWFSIFALIIAVVLNLINTINSHHRKGPGDKMRDATKSTVQAYAEHVRARG